MSEDYYNFKEAKNTRENQLLRRLEEGISLTDFINKDPYDISPVRDDSPYFYKVKRGIPNDYFWLLVGVVFFNLMVVTIPYSVIKKKVKNEETKALLLPLLIFIYWRRIYDPGNFSFSKAYFISWFTNFFIINSSRIITSRYGIRKLFQQKNIQEFINKKNIICQPGNYHIRHIAIHGYTADF